MAKLKGPLPAFPRQKTRPRPGMPNCAATCTTWAAMTARSWTPEAKRIVCATCLPTWRREAKLIPKETK